VELDLAQVSTATDHRAGTDHSAGPGVAASRGSDPADMTEVATLRRLLSQKEMELQSERVRIKQYEVSNLVLYTFQRHLLYLSSVDVHPASAVQYKQRVSRTLPAVSSHKLLPLYCLQAARVRRASSSSASSSPSGRSSAQSLEGQPVVIQVKEWGEKEARDLRTALHAVTGAYKTALERIKLLEDALEQREATEAAAEVRKPELSASSTWYQCYPPGMQGCCGGTHHLLWSDTCLA